MCAGVVVTGLWGVEEGGCAIDVDYGEVWDRSMWRVVSCRLVCRVVSENESCRIVSNNV